MSKEIEDHRLFNHSHNQPFAEVLAQHVSRRDVMRGGLGLAAASMLGFGGAAQALAGEQAKTPLTLAFEAVRGSRTDAIVVPEGYVAQVLVPWGTPLQVGQEWQADQPMTPERQATSVGMHHDGMAGLLDADNASRRLVLALNNHRPRALWAPKVGRPMPKRARAQ